MTSSEVFVGVDVSKARLDVALSSACEVVGFANDEAGVADLVRRVKLADPRLWCWRQRARWDVCWWLN